MSSLKSKQLKQAPITQLSSKDAAFVRQVLDPEFTAENAAARDQFYQMALRAVREGGGYFLDHIETLYPIIKNINAAIDRRDRMEARHVRV